MATFVVRIQIYICPMDMSSFRRFVSKGFLIDRHASTTPSLLSAITITSWLSIWLHVSSRLHITSATSTIRCSRTTSTRLLVRRLPQPSPRHATHQKLRTNRSRLTSLHRGHADDARTTTCRCSFCPNVLWIFWNNAERVSAKGGRVCKCNDGFLAVYISLLIRAASASNSVSYPSHKQFKKTTHTYTRSNISLTTCAAIGAVNSMYAIPFDLPLTLCS
jgi:hypothetical protein